MQKAHAKVGRSVGRNLVVDFRIQSDTITLNPPPAMTVNTINKTDEFDVWLSDLADLTAKAKVLARIKRAELGNFGDAEPVGEGVSEMRIDFGPGYRVYYAREGRVIFLLLNGGDKSTQKADIKRAKALWAAIQKG